MNNSYLNNENTAKMVEFITHLYKALDAWNDMPQFMHPANNADGKGLRFYLANTVNEANTLARSFGIEPNEIRQLIEE